MRLFPRLLLNHLMCVVVTSAVLLAAAELAAQPFIGHHVDAMVRLIGPQGGGLRGDLTHGMRDTLTRALMAALPLALLVATVTAWVAARRVTASPTTACTREPRMPTQAPTGSMELSRLTTAILARLPQSRATPLISMMPS